MFQIIKLQYLIKFLSSQILRFKSPNSKKHFRVYNLMLMRIIYLVFTMICENYCFPSGAHRDVDGWELESITFVGGSPKWVVRFISFFLGTLNRKGDLSFGLLDPNCS